MGSNREKYCYRNIEKLPFLKGKKIISHFDSSNNIFADFTYKNIYHSKYV